MSGVAPQDFQGLHAVLGNLHRIGNFKLFDRPFDRQNVHNVIVGDQKPCNFMSRGHRGHFKRA